MYFPRLYKYRNSYVLYVYIPTVQAFGSLLLTHTLLVQTHIHPVPTISGYQRGLKLIHRSAYIEINA